MSINIFSCENCSHAVLDNNKQIGCKLNILNKISHTYNENRQAYDLEKVCQYKDRDPEKVFLKVGYIFVLDDRDNIKYLKDNIEKIKDRNPIWIAVNNDFPELADDINECLMGLNVPYNIISNYEKIAGDIYRLDQFMSNYINGWTMVNILGKEFNPNLIDILNEYVNQFNALAIAKHSCDSINGFTFFNMIFKFLKGSYPSILDDDTIVQKTFIEKVSEVSSTMIRDWREINEIYCNSSN